MPKCSAGLLMYRRTGSGVEVLLTHPGGPYWASKDLGAWSIPKGEYALDEEPLAAARREFTEETSFHAQPPFLALGEIRQASGKLVTAWAFEGDCDPAAMQSNLCEVEWPPRSGRMIEIPEADRCAWFSIAAAREHIFPAQQPLLERLTAQLAQAVGS